MTRIARRTAPLAALLLVIAACGGGDSADTTEAMVDDTTATTEAMVDEEPSGDCASEETVCIGLVTDVGKVDDKSFNQSAWEGVQQAGEGMGGTFDFIETQDSNDYATNIGTFVDQGYDVIVTVGFALGEATATAATENPDTSFIGVDQFQGETIPNLTGLIFNEDKAGFLAGALAGLLTESGQVAAVLGTDLVPPVVAYGEGFKNGVAYTNDGANTILTYHPGGLDVAFTDPAWGADTARQALDQGVDVVFGAGGLTGNGALGEVAKEGGSAYCIGVDTDQWEIVPEAQPCLVTSAMKLITPAVVQLVGAAVDGTSEGGNFFGDVGLADYHDFASVVPQEVQDQIMELTPQVIDGTVPTGYAP
jgi:basic membrane protein A